jgi:Delta3,5-Delta2,4-dienoyl-CoA isomerase
MWLELKSVFDRLSTDPTVRAIILTGAGDKAFSAGLDVVAATSAGPLSRIEGKDPARAATALRRHILEFQDCITSIEKCEKRTYSVIPKTGRWNIE